jgi:hypothetical protein
MLCLFAGTALTGCIGGLITSTVLALYILQYFPGAVLLLYISSGLCPSTGLVFSFTILASGCFYSVGLHAHILLAQLWHGAAISSVLAVF